MKQCALCRKRDADDTGSHVVPHFLLKRIFNEELSKGRDKEIEFHLTTYDVETHFGRSILPEKKEEVMGELTEEQKEKITFSQLVVDNYWCTSCEAKFAKLEGIYATTLKISGSKIYQAAKDGLEAMMFWLSIFWRASITARMGYTLSASDQEVLRGLIDEYEVGSDNKNFIEKNQGALSQIGYKLIRSADYGKVGSTFSFMGHLRRPYSMIIDDFVIFIYAKKAHVNNTEQMFFDFEKIKDVPINSYDGKELVYGLDHDSFRKSMLKFVDFIKDGRLKFYDQKIKQLYKEFKYTGPYKKHMRDEIIAEVVSDSQALGVKYTLENFSNTATKVFSKYIAELNRK